MERLLLISLLLALGCSCGSTTTQGTQDPQTAPQNPSTAGNTQPATAGATPDLIGAWRNTEHREVQSGLELVFVAEPLTDQSPAERRHFEFLEGGALRAVWRRNFGDHRIGLGRYEVEGNRVTLSYMTEYEVMTRETFEFVSRTEQTLVLRNVEMQSQEPNGIHPANAAGCGAGEYTILRCSPIDAIDTFCAPLPSGCTGCGCFELSSCTASPTGKIGIDETRGCAHFPGQVTCDPGQYRTWTCNGSELALTCRPLPAGCDDCSCFSSVECTRFATGRIQVGPVPSCP